MKVYLFTDEGSVTFKSLRSWTKYRDEHKLSEHRDGFHIMDENKNTIGYTNLKW